MTKLPKNLVEQLVTVLNANAFGSIGRDARIIARVRRTLIATGCIEGAGLHDCTIVADKCGRSVPVECVECGTPGLHDENEICIACNDSLYGEACDECAALVVCNDDGLCANCADESDFTD